MVRVVRSPFWTLCLRRNIFIKKSNWSGQSAFEFRGRLRRVYLDPQVSETSHPRDGQTNRYET